MTDSVSTMKTSSSCDTRVVEEWILNSPLLFRLDTFSKEILAPLMNIEGNMKAVLTKLVFMQQNLAESYQLFKESQSYFTWQVN